MSELRPDLTDDRLSTIPVKTPFERSIIELPSLSCEEEYNFNYGSYDVFCLRSKTEPLIHKIILKPVMLGFESIRSNDRMIMTITAYLDDTFVPFNEEQSKKVSSIVGTAISQDPRHCVLFHFDTDISDESTSNGFNLPQGWILSVIRSYSIDDKYDPIVKNNTLLIDLSLESDYMQVYSDILNKLTSWLIKGYRSSWITCSPSFAQDWKLIPVEEGDTIQPGNDLGTIYKPIWYDMRITSDRYTFLREKLSGNPFVKVEFHNNINNVQIHQIVENLISNGFRFCVCIMYFLIEAYTFEECSFIASLIEDGYRIKDVLKVVEIPISTLDKLSLEISGKSFPEETHLFSDNVVRFGKIINSDIVVYPTADKGRPFTVSGIIPQDLNPFDMNINDLFRKDAKFTSKENNKSKIKYEFSRDNFNNMPNVSSIQTGI